MSGPVSIPVQSIALAGRARREDPPSLVNSGARSVTVAAGYEMWAPTYDRDPNPLLALEERHLLPRIGLCRGKNVLDLACGTGRWLEKVLSLGARPAVGVDLSLSMLRIAALKPPLAGRLIIGDGQSLPIRSGSVDMIICSFAFNHIADDYTLAKELARLAKPKADIFVTDLHPGAYAQGWRTGFRSQDGPLEIATIVRSLQQVRAVLESQGLRLIELKEPHLDVSERPIFSASGRDHLFDEVAAIPAIFICHFTRSADGRS